MTNFADFAGLVAAIETIRNRTRIYRIKRIKTDQTVKEGTRIRPFSALSALSAFNFPLPPALAGFNGYWAFTPGSGLGLYAAVRFAD